MLPPPMIHRFSASGPPASARAFSGEGTPSVPSGRAARFRVTMMFRRWGRGAPPVKNYSLSGPIMTVPFRVREWKCSKSVGSEKSSPPFRPKAQRWSATT